MIDKWTDRPMFALDADVTVYWPEVRPCYDRERCRSLSPEKSLRCALPQGHDDVHASEWEGNEIHPKSARSVWAHRDDELSDGSVGATK